MIKTRFAPSPSGYLHLGNIRTALLSALLARQQQGVFLLRIEDTDAVRTQPEYIHALLADLRWLGLVWQEGPESGGTATSYYQSERGAIYADYFAQLLAQDRVYPCFCTETQLKLVRKQQLNAGQPPRYPGTCARLSAAQAHTRLAQGQAATLRFRVPETGATHFVDQVHGEQRFAHAEIGDFIIRRADGSAAFFFSNAVDDALMAVTHVLRGVDHLSNTPRQLLILQALELPIPSYGHLALINGADGAPLSKRNGSLSVRELQAQGYLPLAVHNYLARLGHHYPTEQYMDLDGLAQGFALTQLQRAPARFDAVQLLHWQREAVQQAPVEVVSAWLEPSVSDPALRLRWAHYLRPNSDFPAQAQQWATRLYHGQLQISAEAQAVLTATTGDYWQAALQAQEQHPTDYQAFMAVLKNLTARKGKSLFAPLRAALTGELAGPELAGLYALLPPTQLRARLNVAAHAQSVQ